METRFACLSTSGSEKAKENQSALFFLQMLLFSSNNHTNTYTPQ